jgi:hypothetical protein
LLLSRAERDYLFELAGVHDPEKAGSVSELHPGETLAEAVAKIQTPAYVLDRAWNAIAWNGHAARLFVGWLDKESSELNLLRYMFLNPQARDFIAEWPLRAHRLVAEFRGDCKAILDDPEISTQIEELRRQSPEFDSFWSAHNVLEREGGERSFLHPILGKMTLRQLTLRLAHSPNLKLVILL